MPLAVERRDPARAEDRKREIERRKGERLARLDGLRVLLVEDDDDSRWLLGTMLKRQGAEVASTSSSFEALNAFEEAAPDVLISDLGMPEENGLELMRKLRMFPAGRGGLVPAIALTGYATPKDRERALAAGYQLHLAKPVEASELIAAIISLVGRMD